MNTDMSLNPEKTHLKLLYLRLTDSAPLILAKEFGLFDRFGLTVELQREPSWATLRDKLIGGAADAAAMLAPMPLTLKPALPHCEEKLVTGLVLSCNGNAITLSRELFSRLGVSSNNCSGEEAGSALAAYLHKNKHDGTPVQLATVYPFSSHTLQLRHWLRMSGIDPDRDLQIQVLPPEQMVERLQRGDIDGYCVGEPWNSIAVSKGHGVIVAACNALMPAMPEKVLAVTKSWHTSNPRTHLALRAALLQACGLLADRSLRNDALTVLAREDYLGLDVESLSHSFNDRLVTGHGQPPLSNPDWHLFAGIDTESGNPSRDVAGRLLELCEDFSPACPGAEESYRPDLYQQTVEFLQRQTQLAQTTKAR